MSDDLSLWSPTSLFLHIDRWVTTFRGEFSEVSHLADVSVHDVVAELARRGFDTDAVVRKGFGVEIALAIGATAGLGLAVRRMHDFELPDTGLDDRWVDFLEKLTGFADVSPSLSSESPQDVLRDGIVHYLRASARTGGFGRILTWVKTAPLDHVLGWVPDEVERLVALPETPPDEWADDESPPRWIVDRFLSTYLSDWRPGSLRMEWRYQHADLIPPVPVREMRFRAVDESALACAIADAAVRASETSRERSTVDPKHLVPVAARYLREGRRPAAAALFEAMRELVPDDAELLNNHGFCLIPDRPREAVRLLQQATTRGYRDVITIANRVLALALDGDLVGALDVAERAYEAVIDTTRMACIAWDLSILSGGVPTLINGDDSRLYFLDVTAEVARLAGDEDRVDLWLERRSALMAGAE